MRLYNGISSSCHRASFDPVEYTTDFNFHNTPNKIADREKMLQGQWPSGGCEYCENIESVGGTSDRQFHLTVPNQVPPELDHDISATKVTPKILEVYLDNVCNLSCLYCWDGFSSRIQQENLRFGIFDQAGVKIQNTAVMHPEHAVLKTKFWQWLELHGHTLSRLHVLGGEPFYQPEFENVLNFLETKDHPDLEFNVVSNLQIKSEKFYSYIDRIKTLVNDKRIKRFDLTASIDCWGPEQEYVRFGLELPTWKTNFEHVVNESWIALNINQTLSSLTIKTVPELVQYINQFRSQREIGHYFSTVVMTHDFLHPEIFGKDFFKTDFDAILLNMPNDTWQQQEARKYMQGIFLQINSKQRDQNLINKLPVFLDEIDRRRGLDWKTTFPWLVKEISHVV